MNCQECQDKLFDYDEGTLKTAFRSQVEVHLEECEDCAALLKDIWNMARMAHQWETTEVPRWQRKETFFSSKSWEWPQMLAMAASIMAVVLVLSDVHLVNTEDGLTLKQGRDSQVSQQLEQKFASYSKTQEELIDSRIADYAEQQSVNNQLLLSTVLDANRRERREDMTDLVNFWSTAQTQQHRETQDRLQYLLASQQEDEKDIRQIGEALKIISFQKGSDM